MDMLDRKDQEGNRVPDTYLYGLSMISKQLRTQKQSKMGSKPIGEETPTKKAPPNAKDTTGGVAKRMRSANQVPVEHKEPKSKQVVKRVVYRDFSAGGLPWKFSHKLAKPVV